MPPGKPPTNILSSLPKLIQIIIMELDLNSGLLSPVPYSSAYSVLSFHKEGKKRRLRGSVCIAFK